MKISGKGNETYLYINGLKAHKNIKLSSNVELLPATCSPEPDDIIKVSKNEVDLGLTTIFLRQVTSQLKITGKDSKELATLAWNSVWDAILLSSILNCNASCNLQCDKPAQDFDSSSLLSVTNYHMRGLTPEPYEITDEDENWIKTNFSNTQELLNNKSFQNAVHSMASFRWHSLPRARLALIWSGIEGLFEIQSEIVFRLSLYIAYYLEPDDEIQRKELFVSIKTLYKHRSAAVHGSKIKGKPNDLVTESAELLNRLIRKCIETKSLPNTENLVI